MAKGCVLRPLSPFEGQLKNLFIHLGIATWTAFKRPRRESNVFVLKFCILLEKVKEQVSRTPQQAFQYLRGRLGLATFGTEIA